MPTILKSVDATVTATPTDEQPGAFEAVVAVFGNTDSQNDVIDKGAFTNTLAAWVAKGQPIPVIYSHDWEDPFSHIGAADPKLAQETDEGLLIKGQMDLGNSKAAQVHKLMKDGLVTQFSFAATTGDGPDAWSLDGDGVQHLKQLNLIEVGPTLRGANQETHLVSIKSQSAIPTTRVAEVEPEVKLTKTDLLKRIEALEGLLVEKQGKVLASKHVDSLKDAHKIIGSVIDAAQKASRPDDGDDESAKSAAVPVQEDAEAKVKARLNELPLGRGTHS